MGRDVYIPDGEAPERGIKNIRRREERDDSGRGEIVDDTPNYIPWGWTGWKMPETSPIPEYNDVPEERVWSTPAAGSKYNVRPKEVPMVVLSNTAYQTIDARV